jgi:hypothetical protein
MTKLPCLNTIGAPAPAVDGVSPVIGAVTPIEGAGIYGVVLLLLATFLTGIWWRWDSPDVRDRHNERERRGF